MKILVIFYSRTGTTKTVGENIANILKCDSEEIFDTKDRMGVMGYMQAGKDAMLKKLTKLKKIQKTSGLYDLVIIGGPVWGFTVSTPIRTYITENKFKNVAFFCTQGGSGAEKAFSEMERLTGKKPKALLVLRTKEVLDGSYSNKVKNFVKEIK